MRLNYIDSADEPPTLQGCTLEWGKNCLKAFGALKKQLASSEVLVHYELYIPLKLVCDASAYPCVSKWH